MPYERIDLSKVKTYHLGERRNLVKLSDLVRPCEKPPPFDNPELPLVARAIREARHSGRPVLWMLGAHVVKSGLSILLIDLMKRGLVTHVAGNGAVSIHDFELTETGTPYSTRRIGYGVPESVPRCSRSSSPSTVPDPRGAWPG